MRRVAIVAGAAVALLALTTVSIPAHSQPAGEDLTPCGTSRPEPGQSGAWAVTFCNRTGHDVVVQFHENDCPADNWGRRGDSYEKPIARGESVTVLLCYAHEPQSAHPAPGVPMLRIPGGKGVVTTWNVVGDCGDRSDRTHVDTRSFYDRGSYESGIILLQYPAVASHCLGTAAASASTPAATSPTSAAPLPPPPPSAPRASAPAPTAAAPVAPIPDGPPSLAATPDPNSRFTRAVLISATSARAYHCKLTMTLTFSDGLSWVDRREIDVPAGARNANVLTRKYGKTVTSVSIDSQKCTQS
jgi:hypothetical protein